MKSVLIINSSTHILIAFYSNGIVYLLLTLLHCLKSKINQLMKRLNVLHLIVCIAIFIKLSTIKFLMKSIPKLNTIWLKLERLLYIYRRVVNKFLALISGIQPGVTHVTDMNTHHILQWKKFNVVKGLTIMHYIIPKSHLELSRALLPFTMFSTQSLFSRLYENQTLLNSSLIIKAQLT